MANLLAQYGIREVADVTLYEGDKPVLFLDTLKVSTIEQTAEQAEARGGKGNSPLIIWDYGKEITITLEDALFTPKSLAIMLGDGTTSAVTTISKIVKVGSPEHLDSQLTTGKKWTASTMYDADMTTTTTVTANAAYVLVTAPGTNSAKIDVNANTFPGTYKLVGDTYARNKETGKDEFFQFVIPQAKMGSENTITLEAEGDPTVFNMTMRVLRPSTGAMMELIKYTV